VAATDSTWAEFDRKWDRMLKERSPVAPYIHMIKLMGQKIRLSASMGEPAKEAPPHQRCHCALSQIDKDKFRCFDFMNVSAIDRVALDGEYYPPTRINTCRSFWRNDGQSVLE